MKILTSMEFALFCKEYYNTKPQHLRFGQAFCNKFEINDDTILFYEQNPQNAIDIIFKKYIKE